MHRLLGLLAAIAAIMCAWGTPVRAQETTPALNLHVQAHQRFQELHRLMQKLQVSKQATEPEESRRLQSGNRFIQEKRIHDGMEHARGLITSGDYDEALQTMDGVAKDLGQLLELLVNRDLELDNLLERLAQLEGFRDRVDQLLEQQKSEKDLAAEAEALLKHLAELEKAKESLHKLIDGQTDLRAEAERNGMAAAAAKAKEMTDREGSLKNDADALESKLEKLESEAKQLASKSESKQDSQPGQPGESGAGASQSMQGASQSMQQAQQKLGQNQPERSLEDMDKALAELNQAQSQLDQLSEEARRRLQQIPFDLQARKQEQTRIDTDRLAQDMENAERGDEKNEGQPTPGKQNVQQAVPKQRAAAGQLKEYKPSDAKQEQQDASDELQKAKQDLEDALAQLRQQLEDEVLRALEERFGDMLARQKELSARTKAVDRAHEGLATDALPAQARDTCTELGKGELGLSGDASDALKLLEEDGRSAAFPMIVEELRDDLDRVGNRLTSFECSTVTQGMQADIEQTLTDLLDALRKTIENRAGGT